MRRVTQHLLCRILAVVVASPLGGGRVRYVDRQVVSYWRGALSVRTDGSRLIRKRRRDTTDNVELYDMSAGPDPIKNLAKTHPDFVRQLSGQIPSQITSR